MTPIKPAAEALERRAEAMRTLACCQMKLTVLSESLQDLAAAVEGSASHRLTVSRSSKANLARLEFPANKETP